MNIGYVKLKQLKYLVLDEADRMLDMGFLDDILRIINHTPKRTFKTLLLLSDHAGQIGRSPSI
ncbi:MAG: DEAD/DEAH box helicase [Bacteroidota bacterium]|nr:MAG: DEAD/DEAH box helicase [Bacteroidota bacterium]